MRLDLSWIEMTKMIPSLLMRFDIELEKPDAEPTQHCWYVLQFFLSKVVDIVTNHRWFVKQEGLNMTLFPRSG